MDKKETKFKNKCHELNNDIKNFKSSFSKLRKMAGSISDKAERLYWKGDGLFNKDEYIIKEAFEGHSEYMDKLDYLRGMKYKLYDILDFPYFKESD